MKKILLTIIIFISAFTLTYAQCAKPSVGITGPATIVVCEGADFTLSGSTSVTGISQNGGFTYSWIKVLPTPLSVFVPPTTISIVPNTTTTIPGYIKNSASLADAGTYVLRVEDGNVGNSACYTEASIVVNINPIIVPGVIAADQTIFSGGDPVAFTQTVATTGGTGVYAYQWQSATAPFTTWAAIASATNATYNAPALTATTYYRRTDASGTCPPVTTNFIAVTVKPTVLPSVTIATPSTNICVGTSITFTATPTNGGTAPTYQWYKNAIYLGSSATNATYTTTTAANNDSYSVVITSNATCPSPATATSNAIVMTVTTVVTPTVTITANPTTICSNGLATFIATPTNGGTAPMYEWSINAVPQGAPTSSATFSTSALTSSTDVVKVILTSNSVCASPLSASATNSISVTPVIGAGTIGSDQTICYNSVPAPIIQLSNPTNIVGNPTYMWEASLTASGPFTPIVGATNATYTSTITITQDVYIRRVTIDSGTPAPCNVATSNTIHITVRPQLVAGIINSDETICAGSNPAAIIQTTAPTGGTGIYTYQWQSENSGVFTYIAGSWSESYTPPILTATTRFQRVDRSGTCGTVTSNVVTKTVTAQEVVTASINDPGQVCAGATVTFTATPWTSGNGQISYQWYLDASPVGTNNPTYTFNPTIADNGKMVRVRANTSTACNAGAVISNVVILNIDPCGAFSTSITGPNPITPGQQNAVYSVTNQTGFAYMWSITGGTIVSGQNTNSVTVDWDAPTTNAFARTTSALYSISVLETNPTSQTKTTTLDINPITTAVAQSQAQSGISVFPNPTTGLFNIEMPESGIDVTYEILDITGLSVASGTFTSTGSNQKMNADFGAGMYQIVLKYNNVVTCVRLTKVE